jgi:hypothetical protein
MFAHTEPASNREVLLVPHAQGEGGFVTERRQTFSYAAIEDVRKLCGSRSWSNSKRDLNRRARPERRCPRPGGFRPR